MNNSVLFVVGNTYQRLNESEAKLNRKGTHRKVHDWVLFVDILQGDADLIQHVKFYLDSSFQPNTFVCNSPVNIILKDGSRVKRFSTRQQSTGAFVPTVEIVGRGGSTLKVSHPISLRQGGSRKSPARFVETRPLQPLKLAKIPERDFGIELELSCTQGTSHQQIASSIQTQAGVPVHVVQEYRNVHNPVQGWKLVHDGSIHCSRNSPNCSKFELVSPILKGEKGLNECSNVLQALRGLNSISVNKSMGFHVHISVEDFPLQSLKKLCQNFVKYEDAMDSFMPKSRRTGSPESNQYFRSNKTAIVGENASNSERSRAIAACVDIRELCNLMNPTGRYYKLNLQNLINNRQPTVEFRQHSASSNNSKVSAWVRFCMAMVESSARLKAPSSLKSSRGPDQQFDMMFEYVIKDRALRNIFNERRSQVISEGRNVAPCCDSCARGHECEASRAVFLPR